MIKRLLTIALICIACVGVGASFAQAATPNDTQYHKPVPKGGVLGTSKTTPKQTAPLAPAKASGTLPFTGVDLGLIAAGGFLVLAAGVGLRRFGRKPGADQ